MSGNLAVSTINGVDISSSPVATEGKVIGVDQTWKDVTASRVAGTTYTNTTGKPIMVAISGSNNPDSRLVLTVDGNVVVTSRSYQTGNTVNAFLSLIIQNGATYSLSSLTGTILTWSELR